MVTNPNVERLMMLGWDLNHIVLDDNGQCWEWTDPVGNSFESVLYSMGEPPLPPGAERYLQDQMLIGLSLSFCVREIAEGKVPMGWVSKIVCGTACETPEQWEDLIGKYRRTYWSDEPTKCEAILRSLLAYKMIEQPRLDGRNAPNLARGVWVIDDKSHVDYRLNRPNGF